ncbi:MAG: hypothetical protein HC878_17460 [Leptolyngbyaceae cyanobacterium SL_5_14]|nr:hypothetical protein [Leptolyngbyaceae cyanobacterium SL_5_14]
MPTDSLAAPSPPRYEAAQRQNAAAADTFSNSKNSFQPSAAVTCWATL